MPPTAHKNGWTMKDIESVKFVQPVRRQVAGVFPVAGTRPWFWMCCMICLCVPRNETIRNQNIQLCSESYLLLEVQENRNKSNIIKPELCVRNLAHNIQQTRLSCSS